jgi:hypothetical protein
VRRLSGIDEFLGRDLDVAGNLPQQDRGNVTTLVKRNRRAAAVRMPELLVRPFSKPSETSLVTTSAGLRIGNLRFGTA